MRTAGRLLAEIFDNVKSILIVGMTSRQLDFYVEGRMRAVGLVPSCKGYAGYRHATCISVNDAVIHGVPSDGVIFQLGDCIKLDVVGSYQGYCADMARTYILGGENQSALSMLSAAQFALDAAIKLIGPGIPLGNVSAKIQYIVESSGYSVVRTYAGHGIGKNIHEEPEVPNYGKVGTGPMLLPGMALAIEPMVTQFKSDVYIDADRWTVRTVDHGLAVHVEDTVVVTASGVEVLTRLS